MHKSNVLRRPPKKTRSGERVAAGVTSIPRPVAQPVIQKYIPGSVLSGEGLLRLKQILGDPTASPPVCPIIPVSKSTWWLGVRTGRFPKPVKYLGANTTAWRARDIKALVEKGELVGASE